MKRVIVFFRGMYEFRRDCTWADPSRVATLTELDEAYDLGREWAHRLTLRRYDQP
jgi:hypothetical protein